MSRLVMNMIQYEFGVVPSIVRKENRAEYIESLSLSQETGNEKPFLDFMTEHHCRNIEERIEKYKSSLNHDTLNLKNDTLIDTINLTEKEMAIFSLIKANENITISEITEETGFSRPTINRAISSLKEKGILIRKGAKKNGSWLITI